MLFDRFDVKALSFVDRDVCFSLHIKVHVPIVKLVVETGSSEELFP